MTLIAGKHLHIDSQAAVGAGALLNAEGQIQLGQGASVGAESTALALQQVHLHKSATFSGLVYTRGDVKLHAASVVYGSVIALGDVYLQCGAVVIHDCDIQPPLPPGLSTQPGSVAAPACTGDDCDDDDDGDGGDDGDDGCGDDD